MSHLYFFWVRLLLNSDYFFSQYNSSVIFNRLVFTEDLQSTFLLIKIRIWKVNKKYYTLKTCLLIFALNFQRFFHAADFATMSLYLLLFLFCFARSQVFFVSLWQRFEIFIMSLRLHCTSLINRNKCNSNCLNFFVLKNISQNVK